MARKRLQKVFALLLTASMAMSLMSVGAAADETGEEARGTIEIEVGQNQEIVSTMRKAARRSPGIPAMKMLRSWILRMER